jgi:hypothetical protein
MTSSTEFAAAMPGSGPLVDVVVETLGGDLYQIPGVDGEEVRKVLPESGRRPQGQPTLSIINSQMSVMSVLFRIIKRITLVYKNAHGETWDDVVWEDTCSASAAEPS